MLVSTTGACSASSSASGGPKDAKKWDQANAEYLAEAKSLTLPQGLAFPVHLPRERTTNGSPNTFGDGVGRGQADHLWYCGWQGTWLKDLSTGRTKAAHSDLATMKNLTHLSMYTLSTTAGDKHIYTDAWARADLGDPSLVQQDFTANCDLRQLSGA